MILSERWFADTLNLKLQKRREKKQSFFILQAFFNARYADGAAVLTSYQNFTFGFSKNIVDVGRTAERVSRIDWQKIPCI